MISSESRRDWMHRFGSRLMKLEPALNAVNAARHAVAAYETHGHSAEPEDAAATFATERAGGSAPRHTTPSGPNEQRVLRRHAG